MMLFIRNIKFPFLEWLTLHAKDLTYQFIVLPLNEPEHVADVLIEGM